MCFCKVVQGCARRSQHAAALHKAVSNQLGFADRLAAEHPQHRIGADAGFGFGVKEDGGQRRGQQFTGVVTAESRDRDVLRDAQPQFPRRLVYAVGDAVGGAQQDLRPVGLLQNPPRNGIGRLVGEIRQIVAHIGHTAGRQAAQDPLFAAQAHGHIILRHPQKSGAAQPPRRHIAAQFLAGGKDNIVASTHCATRLRIVLKDYDKINKEGIDNIDLVKGKFVAGNQLQIIFGAGLVNEIYEVFSAYTGTAGSSMADVKQEAAKKMNPLQAVIKSLSDVFVDIMPGILAAALLSGLTGVLSQWDVVAGNATLFGINRLVSLASNGIFSILPLAVCYSACKRYGGKPILGLVMGAIMLDGSLANAYDAAQGLVQPDSISLFGLNIELVGFQGGIIIALMMGFIVAKLDIFFDKKIPDVVKLLFSPMCSVLISTVLLFTIVGPAGRLLSNGITNGLIWMTQNLGLLGYMVFGGVQQIIVITGLHHIFGADDTLALDAFAGVAEYCPMRAFEIADARENGV